MTGGHSVAGKPSLTWLIILSWADHVLLALGLFAPCMTITPHFGRHDALARWLGLLKEPKTYSIATGVLKLLEGGNVPIGLLLLVFSVLFPVAKLIVLRAAIHDARRGLEPGRARGLVSAFGKYSMVDVFFIALLVLASQTLPGGTTVEIRWGAYAFAAAALVALPVAVGVGGR
jgi:paraquat-inducible protein A